MTKEQYDKSIETGELQLGFWNKVSHFSIVLFLFFVPVLFLGIHLYEYLIGNSAYFAEGEIKIMIIALVVGVLFYWLQKSRLKFKKISTNLTSKELIPYIEELCKEWNWTISYHSDGIVVAKTNVSFISGSWGEQVTIILNNNIVLVNSICDLDKRSSLVSMGHNRENVKAVIDLIANTNALTTKGKIPLAEN